MKISVYIQESSGEKEYCQNIRRIEVELKEEKMRNKKLRKELIRKEKALAEIAA